LWTPAPGVAVNRASPPLKLRVVNISATIQIVLPEIMLIMKIIDVEMNNIHNFVGRFAGAKPIKPGESVPLHTDIESELQEIYRKYRIAEQALDVKKAANNQEWHSMFRQVGEEYAPRFQAWADKHKLGYQFNMNPPV